jgi:hypothetical protein
MSVLPLLREKQAEQPINQKRPLKIPVPIPTTQALFNQYIPEILVNGMKEDCIGCVMNLLHPNTSLHSYGGLSDLRDDA